MTGKYLASRNKGQMLIEIVVAIGIIGLVLVGISDLMTRSLMVVSFQKQKAESLLILKKMITDYRIARDSNPESFYDTAANAILNPCVPGKIYKCTVTMQKSAEAVLVSIVAEWQDGGKTYSTSLSQSFTRDLK